MSNSRTVHDYTLPVFKINNGIINVNRVDAVEI